MKIETHSAHKRYVATISLYAAIEERSLLQALNFSSGFHLAEQNVSFYVNGMTNATGALGNLSIYCYCMWQDSVFMANRIAQDITGTRETVVIP